MFNKKLVLAVSLFSIFLIGAARADIASTTYYVGEGAVSVNKNNTTQKGVISVRDATASAAGVTVLGTIPSGGQTGEGTARIWIQ